MNLLHWKILRPICANKFAAISLVIKLSLVNNKEDSPQSQYKIILKQNLYKSLKLWNLGLLRWQTDIINR